MNIKTKKNKILMLSMIITFLIFSILLIYIIKTSVVKDDILKNNNVEDELVYGDEIFSEYFSNCSLLEDKCLSTKCDKYFLCNDKNYETCEIYDCINEYGIGTIDDSGKKELKREMKDQSVAIQKIRNDCKGEIVILKGGCDESNQKLNIKVKTSGSCSFSSFKIFYLVDGEEEYEYADFEKLNDEEFLLSMKDCSNIQRIRAISDKGISVEKTLNKE